MPRLLFIDDNESFRVAAATALQRAGYDVVQAADGAEGLAKATDGEFALVISDLVMPNTDGVQVITELRRRHPNLPILAISGGDTHSKAYLKVAAVIGANRILEKPFRPAAFLRTVAELAGAGNAPSRKI